MIAAARQPYHHLEALGLVPLLFGTTIGLDGRIVETRRELIVLDGSTATQQTTDGRLQTYRGRPADPLASAERLVI